MNKASGGDGIPVELFQILARLLRPWDSPEHWSGLPFPPPGDLPDAGIEPASLMSPALAGGFFTTSDTWEASIFMVILQTIQFSFSCILC